MPEQTLAPMPHTRADRCPGVTRPWPADDGALVRLRIPGGTIRTDALRRLVDLAAAFGDGDVHLTGRANLQLRAVPMSGGALPDGFVAGVRRAGLLPSPAHDLVRNVMLSPLSGRRGGRADLRPVAAELDTAMCADDAFGRLAGRFLFVLDDGRGDLVGRTADLAAIALDARTVQLRAGADLWGPVLPLDRAARALLDLARRFLGVRGDGAAWHVDELDVRLLEPVARDPRTQVTAGPPPLGRFVQDDGREAELVDVRDGRLGPEQAAQVLARAGHEVVVTPWHGLLLPDLAPADAARPGVGTPGPVGREQVPESAASGPHPVDGRG